MQLIFVFIKSSESIKFTASQITVTAVEKWLVTVLLLKRKRKRFRFQTWTVSCAILKANWFQTIDSKWNAKTSLCAGACEGFSMLTLSRKKNKKTSDLHLHKQKENPSNLDVSILCVFILIRCKENWWFLPYSRVRLFSHSPTVKRVRYSTLQNKTITSKC